MKYKVKNITTYMRLRGLVPDEPQGYSQTFLLVELGEAMYDQLMDWVRGQSVGHNPRTHDLVIFPVDYVRFLKATFFVLEEDWDDEEEDFAAAAWEMQARSDLPSGIDP